MSLGEDGLSGVLSVTAVLWPVVAAVIAVALLIAIVLAWRSLRRRWTRRRSGVG